MKISASNLVQYCQSTYGSEFSALPGAQNIVYLEGCNFDLTPNRDEFDGWNDLRCLITMGANGWEISFKQVATSEPGRTATFSKEAKRLGGVARLAIGWHPNAWKDGFHKQRIDHPALVQAPGALLRVHRDLNQDGKRTGDPITTDAAGINHHGTGKGKKPKVVGLYSAGCPAGLVWEQHLVFVSRCMRDPRHSDPSFLYSSTICDFSAFVKA